MRTIFFGTPDFAVPSLKSLLESGHDIISVVTQPDRVKGRGHKMSQPPVKEFALANGLPVIQPRSVRTTDFFEELASLAPDVICVVAYGRIIPPHILKLPPFGCINVHGSLLPKYRGAAPVQWSIINGDEKTGITTMLMDEGLDTGDMLLCEETVITDEDNAFSLGARLSEMGASLLVKTIRGLQENLIRPIPQKGEPTYAPPLKKEDGRIDWAMPAKKISDLIRGTFPWPGAYCYLTAEKITIIKAGVTGGDYHGVPGNIVKVSGKEISVATGEGMLSILEVKPEGKRSMTASAFVNGRRIKEGMSFDIS